MTRSTDDVDCDAGDVEVCAGVGDCCVTASAGSGLVVAVMVLDPSACTIAVCEECDSGVASAVCEACDSGDDVAGCCAGNAVPVNPGH